MSKSVVKPVILHCFTMPGYNMVWIPRKTAVALRKARLVRHRYVAGLVRATGISAAAIVKLEAGNTATRRSVLQRYLAEVPGVSVLIGEVK
jgi:predicted transcriptional regulator